MKKIYAVIVGCATLAVLAAPSEFVIKKNKQPSSAILKEQCGDQMIATLSLTPKSLQAMGMMQEISLKLMPAVLEGSFFDGKDKKRIEKDAHIISTLYERQQLIDQLMCDQVADLRTLERKS